MKNRAVLDAERSLGIQILLKSEEPGAFTLIELLIVVAIISILAAIAIPNFLEAQTRSKVSRAKADMRTIALALETYRLDNNAYLPNRGIPIENEPVHTTNGHGRLRVRAFRTIPLRLSTPVAYIVSSAFPDLFKHGQKDTDTGDSYHTNDPTDMGLTYHNLYEYVVLLNDPEVPYSDFGVRDGHWRILSIGPDRLFTGFHAGSTDWKYDPTNGTASRGDIVRSHFQPAY